MVITNNGVSAPTHSRPGAGGSPSPQNSSTSFADQLASAIENYLNSSDNGSHIEINIESAQSQTGGQRQFIVTVKDPSGSSVELPVEKNSPAAAAPDASDPAPPAAPQDPLAKTFTPGGMMGSGYVAYVPKATPAADTAPKTEDDAYWATQPPEVQVLRTINDEGERTAKAQDLAAAGYSIDVPIMVWRWDPLMTMRARQSAGYTWVPSANQPAVQVAPGIDFPGLQSYDPANPPAGSIPVSTEWAKGLEQTSPWWRGAVTDAPTVS